MDQGHKPEKSKYMCHVIITHYICKGAFTNYVDTEELGGIPKVHITISGEGDQKCPKIVPHMDLNDHICKIR